MSPTPATGPSAGAAPLAGGPPRPGPLRDAATLLSGLPRVVLDSPGAVLVVDVGAGQVTYANSLAADLAPGARLPIDVLEWSALAGLQDRDGAPAAGPGSTMARIVAGEQVTGETVTAHRATRATSARESLWVMVLPLAGGASPLASSSLVLLLPLRDEVASVAAGSDVTGLTTAAVLASTTSFTISDARLPDRPLVWVNPAFETVTGYSAETAVGRNCRFLQGPGTDREHVARVRAALDAGRGVEQVLLNYRSDGSRFWNALSVSPLFDGQGTLTHFVAVQADVTAAVDAQRELASALALADAARADAEAAHREADTARRQAEAARERAESAWARVSLLAEVTGVLAATLDVEAATRQLCELVVPDLADWAVLTLVDTEGVLQATTLHRDGHEEEMERWLELRATTLARGSATADLLGTTVPRLIRPEEISAAREATPELPWEELDRLIAVVGLSSAMVMPVVARRRVLGTLSLVRGASGREYDTADLAVAVDLAKRAGLALDNARLYAAEHSTAVTLQRSLLPPVPEVAGLDAAAAYLPGNDRAEVGGDWYDVLDLPGGGTGLAIGDVMGHDLTAAASMGQLRSVLRSYAWEGGDPATVLDRLDQLVQGLGMADLATCVYARLDDAEGPDDEGAAGAATAGLGAPGGSRRLVWANAGHHPPLLRRPDGRVESLEGATSVLIGVDAPREGGRAQAERTLEPGSVLLLFTDGLIEARAQGIDPGLARVRATLAAHRPDDGCVALTRALASGLLALGQEDDVCLLAVRLL